MSSCAIADIQVLDDASYLHGVIKLTLLPNKDPEESPPPLLDYRLTSGPCG